MPFVWYTELSLQTDHSVTFPAGAAVGAGTVGGILEGEAPAVGAAIAAATTPALSSDVTAVVGTATASGTVPLVSEEIAPAVADALAEGISPTITGSSAAPVTTPQVGGWHPWLREPVGIPIRLRLLPGRVDVRAYAPRLTLRSRVPLVRSALGVYAHAATIRMSLAGGLAWEAFVPQRVAQRMLLDREADHDALTAQLEARLAAEVWKVRDESQQQLRERDRQVRHAARAFDEHERRAQEAEQRAEWAQRRAAEMAERAGAAMTRAYELAQGAESARQRIASLELAAIDDSVDIDAEFARLIEDTLIAAEA